MLTWSDESGVYKPDALAFELTLAALGVDPGDAVHVGDRLRTDIGGARGAGMGSIRYRGIYDDDEPLPEADHVINDLSDVAAIVARA